MLNKILLFLIELAIIYSIGRWAYLAFTRLKRNPRQPSKKKFPALLQQYAASKGWKSLPLIKVGNETLYLAMSKDKYQQLSQPFELNLPGDEILRVIYRPQFAAEAHEDKKNYYLIYGKAVAPGSRSAPQTYFKIFFMTPFQHQGKVFLGPESQPIGQLTTSVNRGSQLSLQAWPKESAKKLEMSNFKNWYFQQVLRPSIFLDGKNLYVLSLRDYPTNEEIEQLRLQFEWVYTYLGDNSQ